jgi:hypothetical protein
MYKHLLKKGTLELKFETGELSAAQIRLIKSLNYSLITLITTTDEAEFFDKTKEIFKQVSSAVKDSHFSEMKKNSTTIPYAQQAIEFSVEEIVEPLYSQHQHKISGLDN